MGNERPVVMITGAAGNLGRAAAEVFGQRGARLILIDIDDDTLRAAYPDDSPQRLLIAADLTAESAVASSLAPAMARFGGVDVLCNIAGMFHYGMPVHQMPRAIWSRLHEINAGSVINVVKTVVPGMLEAGSGTVFTIGAAGHVQGHAHMGAYAASKSEVMRLTESMAEELAGSGVSVFCLMPNIIDTPQNRTAMPQADFSGWTSPADIAEVMWLLTAKPAALMSGCLIPLKGKVLR